MRYLTDYRLFEAADRTKSFQLFESDFYNNTNEEKVVKYLQSKLDYITGKSTQDTNLSSLIYNFILRSTGKTNVDLQDFAEKTKQGYSKMINGYLNYQHNNVLKFYPNPDKENMQWLEAKYNRAYIKNEKTYNYYLTFIQTEQNLKSFFISIAKLISKLFDYCSKNKSFECGFKFGSDSEYFINEKDHLKFYYYDPNNKDQLLKLINEWLDENAIKTEKRPYDHAIDSKDSSGKKTSFGDIASQEIAKNLEELMKSHKDKFTAKQYYDWLIKYMSNAKYNIIEK